MIRIRLPETEAQELAAAVRSTEDRTLRDRLPIVLLAHQGRKHQDIAADLGISRRSVPRWLNAYLERGSAGLAPSKAEGKTPRIPATMADELRRWVIEGPAGQGLDRPNWTHKELAAHLFTTHGIKTSRSAMHRFGSKIDIRPARPPYRYRRDDPDKHAQATEDLAGLKKRWPQANSSC